MAFINGNEVFLAADITKTQVIQEQLVCLTGEGAPTTETYGFVGSLYMDTNNGNLYKCISTVDGVFVWVLQDGSGGSVEIADNLTTRDPNKALSANMGWVLANMHNLNRITEDNIDIILDFEKNSLDVFYPSISAMVKYVGDKTGDIETALDGIIAIQDELIGGDA